MNVPSFTIHDATNFPLVEIKTDRLMRGYATQWMLEMEMLLCNEKAFVLLLYDAERHDESHEDRKQTVLWFKRNRQAFGRVCRGIVGIEPNKTKRTLKRAHGNHLHGGTEGFDRKLWNTEDQTVNRITFSSVSEDGEMGFPGRARLRTTYELTDDNRLLIAMEAKSDKLTLINMVNHAYFNLSGQGNGEILDHVVRAVRRELLHACRRGPAGDRRDPRRQGHCV
ncbi:hypothetical protein [uncultured Martelella sp.]|uniref:aldose epimerase family protein n=1 Tax=uncultured Martelella sp. TaxID=392331 RepID=UPI0029C8D9C3|nr:hypothetical protein [uncultured Martelella sp.]